MIDGQDELLGLAIKEYYGKGFTTSVSPKSRYSRQDRQL